MTTLITGSSGFLGNNINKYLNEYSSPKIFLLSREELNSPNAILSDIFANQNVKVVIHLAAKANDKHMVVSTDEYFEVNYGLTQKLFNIFLQSEAQTFIFLSSVKAVAETLTETILTEEYLPSPSTAYGKSKLAAETYLLSQQLSDSKKLYILRPCMIHGARNKGNLRQLFKLVSIGLPWPLGAFDNQRSFCSVGNLMFIIKELTEREDIPSGIYNVADDEPISTNEVIGLIAQSQYRNPRFWNFSRKFIEGVASIGDKLRISINTERLQKLTSSYVVSNAKIKAAIGKPLPVSSREGLLKTFESFNSK